MRRLTAVLAFALPFGLLIAGCDSGLTGPEEQPEALTPKTSQQGPADEAKLSQQLNAVRKATKKYRDVKEARKDGYVIVSEYVPGMGFHFTNPALIADHEGEEVDITEPPILVYFTTGNYNPGSGAEHEKEHDDDLRLGAVEYAHVGDRQANEDLEEGEPPQETPADYFSDEDANRSLKVSEEHGWHWTPGPNFTALHAWVHRGNPAGVFHPTNPTIDPQTETDHH